MDTGWFSMPQACMLMKAPTSPSARHASDPHYGPTPETSAPIRKDDLLLLDVWGKFKTPGSVYYDVTWIGYWQEGPEKVRQIFRAVQNARDKAVDLICSTLPPENRLQGWQVDKAARAVIEKAGYGKYFSIAPVTTLEKRFTEAGANMDDLETHDVRRLIRELALPLAPASTSRNSAFAAR